MQRFFRSKNYKKMKTIKYLTLSALSCACILSCQPSQQQIKASADQQMLVNKALDSAFRVLDDSYQTYHASTMDAALEGLNSYVEKAETQMQQMESLSQNADLTKAICEKIAIIKAIAKTQAIEQVRIYKLPDTAFSDALRQRWDDLDSQVKKQLNEANSKIESAYQNIQTNTKNK